MLTRNVLYGLKSSGAAFRAFLERTLDEMGYRPRYANLDLWLRPAVNTDGFKYYKYILCYVDNVLCISHNPRKSMKRIQEDFKLKGKNIEFIDVYLGASLAKMKLESGKYCCTMSPGQYVNAAVTNMEEDLARSGKRLP